MTVGEIDIDAFVALVSQGLEPNFEKMSGEIREVKTSVDGLYKQFETLQQEYLAIGHQLDGHEERIQRLEKKVA